MDQRELKLLKEIKDALTPLQAERWSAVTPSDTDEISLDGQPTGVPSRLYIGTGGSLTIENKHGDVETFVNIPNGSLLPISVLKVRATGTDASDIIALW